MKYLALLPLLLLHPCFKIQNTIKCLSLTRPGKDFALFFAVKDYSYWRPLNGPIQDAQKIATELKTHYGFATEIVENPTLEQIYAKLQEYRAKTYAPDAQLLIFFSGHGAFLEESREGFFIPRNGATNKDDPWLNKSLPHARLSNAVESIPCQHTLLAIDACYSGTFMRDIAFKGNDERPGTGATPDAELQAKIKILLEPKTRLLLTSGGKERTPDPSDFAAKFLQGLQSNRRIGGHLLDVYQLCYNHLKSAIPEPKFGAFADNAYESNFLFVFTPPMQQVITDRDEDGVSNTNDHCPDEYGLASTYGCPDGDEDGVPDKSDRCKYLKGEKKWQGCPDSDNDGIPNHDDSCPNEKGPPGGNGCPNVDSDQDKRTKELIDQALRNYQIADNRSSAAEWFLPMLHFPSSSNQIKYSDYGNLAGVGRMMKANPNIRLLVTGFNDAIGSESVNNQLSFDRAKNVIEHLVNIHGIARSRFVLQWKSSADSLVPTSSSYMNRRVEFHIASPDDVEKEAPTTKISEGKN